MQIQEVRRCFAYIPVFIDPIGGTILGTPVIGATIPGATIPGLTMPNGCVGNGCVGNGCVGNGCAILKAAIGTGFVFKGAIGATDGIPTINKNYI